MDMRLYVIPGSHPSIAAELMLQRKGLPYKRRDLISAAHKPLLRSLGFSGTTVPALRADGRKIQGSRDIARFLEELQPEPPLYPGDEARRSAIEEAERWGEERLQQVPRRLAWYAMGEDRRSVREFLQGYKLGVPTSVAAATAAPIIWVEKKIQKSTPELCRADLQRLPELLDHVDELIEQGVIGGPEPNAADFQIATSIRLLMLFDQLRPLIAPRPAANFAVKVVPTMNGHFPPVLPADWIPA